MLPSSSLLVTHFSAHLSSGARPRTRPKHENKLQALQDALDKAAFELACATGRAVTHDEGIAYALGER
jgi:hypothetical protein